MNELDYKILEINKLPNNLREQALKGLFSIHKPLNGLAETPNLYDPYEYFKEQALKGKIFCILRNEKIISAASTTLIEGNLKVHEIWSRNGQKDFYKKHKTTPALVLSNYLLVMSRKLKIKYGDANFATKSGIKFSKKISGNRRFKNLKH